MNLKNIAAGAFALLVAGLLIAGVGTYTQNGGFQLAGAFVLLAGLVVAVKQAFGVSNQS